MIDIPGNVSTQAVLNPGASYTLCTIDSADDSDWYRVALTKGQHYAFNAQIEHNSYSIALHNNKGAVVKQASGTSYSNGPGVEYTALYSGIYYVDFHVTSAKHAFCRLRFVKDCAGNKDTTCSVPLHGSKTGQKTFPADVDFWRFNATKGIKYTAALRIPILDEGTPIRGLDLQVIDNKGNLIDKCRTVDFDKCTVPFVAGANAPYFLRVTGGIDVFGDPYNDIYVVEVR